MRFENSDFNLGEKPKCKIRWLCCAHREGCPIETEQISVLPLFTVVFNFVFLNLLTTDLLVRVLGYALGAVHGRPLT